MIRQPTGYPALLHIRTRGEINYEITQGVPVPCDIHSAGANFRILNEKWGTKITINLTNARSLIEATGISWSNFYIIRPVVLNTTLVAAHLKL